MRDKTAARCRDGRPHGEAYREDLAAMRALPGVEFDAVSDLCQDFGHVSSRNQAAIGMASGLGSVLSKKAAMASAGTL